MARLLLVDDEKIARNLYGDYLTAAGHIVTAVPTVADAKAALSAERFDAVVTDLILPGGDGMEVLRHVRERYPGVEVVVITGLDKVAPAVRAIKSGAAEYLVKPVAPEALQHALRRALTTRDLMRENASLRQHVALLEAGQRIATTLDRERLATATSDALESMAGASAVMLLERDPSAGFRAHGMRGLPQDLHDTLVPVIIDRLSATREPTVLDGLQVPWPRTLTFPAVDGDTVLGHAVLFHDSAPPEHHPETVSFLVRNWALALRNLGRFAAVEDLAYVDDLTRLFNTRYLQLVLDREVNEAVQTQRPFSLLFLDLDRFKTINDTHGHLVGSRVLVEAARVLKGCVRDPDVVARFGGDEYVVLLRGTDSGGALKVAERIRRTMETHQFLGREGLALKLTTCIGVASFPEHAQDKDHLLDLSDRAMYRGKRGSRNVVYVAAQDLEATPAERRQGPPTPNTQG
ncbi:diguanylate cyclase [Corallococcus praedator]|uniref:diguanylate cyclase n=1 Tax=Corallococcus praedator TaxID=2316724 RepID=A0ABX9QBA3_9BACT|nr:MULTISPECIES: diguanylate cyclase [Corallococcus]RKH11342.1 diguanylate cyclase [Corallococcus sp. CA047B]RKH35840.1 diguanylate cyclase [Corallococcus sp. CA031C]RKH99802.1 diguanylate cyclase [Corallococcus praedator]